MFFETVATLPGDLGLIPIAEALKSATSRTGGKPNVIAQGPEPCSPGISRARSRIGPGSLATVSVFLGFRAVSLQLQSSRHCSVVAEDYALITEKLNLANSPASMAIAKS